MGASLSIVVVAILAMLCATTYSHAQAKYLGAISGVVSDSTGATIPGAAISAKDTTTQYVSNGSDRRDGCVHDSVHHA